MPEQEVPELTEEALTAAAAEPFTARLSADGSHWIVVGFGDRAMWSPDGGTDFGDRMRAEGWAQSWNRDHAQWLVRRAKLQTQEALEQQAEEWRSASEAYAQANPRMSASMAGNADRLEALTEILLSGTRRLAELLPGWAPIGAPTGGCGAAPSSEAPVTELQPGLAYCERGMNQRLQHSEEEIRRIVQAHGLAGRMMIIEWAEPHTGAGREAGERRREDGATWYLITDTDRVVTLQFPGERRYLKPAEGDTPRRGAVELLRRAEEIVLRLARLERHEPGPVAANLVGIGLRLMLTLGPDMDTAMDNGDATLNAAVRRHGDELERFSALMAETVGRENGGGT